MSFNKDKAMRNAERYLTQGKIIAAIGEYKQIVEQDPRDVNTQNMLGDLYTKANKPAEAVECYRKVATYYGTQGFAKKAIALYNKIYKIEPDSIEVSAKLADLYRQRGALAEAKKHYVALAAHYESKNKSPEALETWERIAELDPNNTEIHLKIAEAYWKENRETDAASAFIEAGKRLSGASRHESAVTAFSRSLEIKPLDFDAIEGLVRAQLVLGYPEEAAKVLQEKIQSDPFDRATNYLLIDCFYDMNDAASAESVIIKMVEREPSNYPKFLDLIDVYLKSDDLDSAVRVISMITEHMLVGGKHEALFGLLEEILNRNPEHIAALRLVARYHSWLKDEVELKTVLYQILETSNLEGAVEDEKYALTELSALVPHDKVLSDRLRELGVEDTEFRDFQPVGKPEAALQHGEYTVPDSEVQDVELVANQDDVAVIGEAGFEIVGQAQAVPQADASIHTEQVAGEVEDSSPVYAEVVEESIHTAFQPDTSEQQQQQNGVNEMLRSETDQSEASSESETSIDTSAVSQDQPQLNATEELRLEEAIESIKFYIEQGYNGLADKSLQEIELEFGNRPEIHVLRAELAGVDPAFTSSASVPAGNAADDQAEFAAQSDEDSGPTEEVREISPDAVLVDEPVEQTQQPESETDGEADTVPVSDSSADIPEVAEAADDADNVDDGSEAEAAPELADQPVAAESTHHEEVIADYQDVYDEESEALETAEAESAAESEPVIEQPEEADMEADAESGAVSESEETVDFAVHAFDDEDIEAISYQDSGSAPAGIDDSAETSEFEPDGEVDEAVEQSIESGPETIEAETEPDFSNSYENLKDELGLSEETEETDDDFENHYHHAVAYKEMGLTEEAIREFQGAVNTVDPNDGTHRFLNCCTLLADCFLEKGMPNLAVIWFKRAFETEGLSSEETSGLHYALGNAHELAGEYDEAVCEFENIYAIAAGYRDVSERVEKLREKSKASV